MKQTFLAILFSLFGFAVQAQQPAQQPAFVPIMLDINKATQLIDEVPMTTETRARIVKLIQEWEKEAKNVELVPVPADKATNGRK